MGLIFRWLVRLFALALVLAVLAVATIYYLASRSLPDYNRAVALPGLTEEVEIIRDNANVPHIFGSNDKDVFFGLGYAHAQDRLWQMIVLRRTAQGRLSEVFGTRTVETDKLLRRLDLYGHAVRSARAQSPEAQAALSAYARGINARIAEINRDSLGRGAPELFLFNQPMAPWQPADSLAIIKLMALQMAGHLQTEVLRARLSLLFPDDTRLRDLLPEVPGPGVAALPEYAALVPGEMQHRIASLPVSHRGLLSPVPPPGLAGASNAWAAAPARSAAGGTLLANDPHLGFSAPSIWYLARIELASGGVIGATIPGLPLVLSGRSARLGWGLTSSYLDDQDVFIEEVNPDNSEQYRTPDGWKTFRTRRSIIEIRESLPITVTLRWTDNGPVLSGADWKLGEVTPRGYVAALGWTALVDDDTSFTAGFNLMQARNIDAGLRAGEDFVAPAQNLTLVDETRIALKTIGRMPRRKDGKKGLGRVPSLGAVAENRWDGSFPYSANPEFVAPQGGIVGNTNNKVVDRPYPLHLSFHWGDTQRVRRWQRLMQSRQVHTRDSFIETQLDTVSFTARSLLPLVGADLWFTEEAAPEGTPQRRRQEALALLADWNGEMNEHLPEPLIYTAWLRALQDRLIRDEVGPLADEMTRLEPLFIERVYRDVDGASAWCDVIQSAPTETCTDIARLALDDALVWIDETYGTRLDALRWGDAHQAAHDHPVLGEVPVLRYFVNIRQSTSGGDFTLMRGVGRGTGPDPFLNVHGAAYRGVYDFADPDSSVFIISTGQSGHFLSRHYDNMGQLWRRGEYVPMSLDPDLARAGAVGEMRLLPGGD